MAGDAESIGAIQLSKALRDIELLAYNRNDWSAMDTKLEDIKTLAELTINELGITV
ncbi:hypothetical protein [Vibrio tritonius]|uniref:hypothetical protein n=1 Tax=Vibrio tritonius TaxID=1435069 RepID=UPI0038B68E34